MPEREFVQLLPHLTTIPLQVRQVLHVKGELLGAVYFPNGGVVSITTLMNDGRLVEVATIGDEGMVGIEAYLGAHAVALGDTMLQVPDTSAEMMTVKSFRQALLAHHSFSELVGRYAQIVVAQMMQSTACNALHPVQQRCARWLLTDARSDAPAGLQPEPRIPGGDAGRGASDRQHRRRRPAAGGADPLLTRTDDRAGPRRIAGSLVRVLRDRAGSFRPSPGVSAGLGVPQYIAILLYTESPWRDLLAAGSSDAVWPRSCG